ncbi:MAG: H-NS histone family protein [Pseudomonadota bacterium]
MSSLLDIQSQIEKLQKQASEIRTREFDKTVKEIRSKMQAFGITLKDLQVTAQSARRSKKTTPSAAKAANTSLRKKVASVVAVKYRGPNGEAWSGRGLTPRWLATLLSQGRNKDDFLINK